MADVVVPRSQTRVEVPTLPGAAKAVTLSDTTTYDNDGIGVCVFVGVGGDVAIVPSSGDRSTAVTFKNVASGNCVPCRAYKIMSTNTTATNLVALL